MSLHQRAALLAIAAMFTACANDALGPSDPAPEPDPENVAPAAAFTAACSGLTCTMTDESVDADGHIEVYRWDFGDGAVSTASDPSHTYSRPGGQFSVSLVVTDDAGDSATITQLVTVQAGQSGLVTASFISHCTGLVCSFLSRSTGPVAGHVWDFGDGGVSDRPSPDYTYGQPGGRFNVTLTVIDSAHAESTSSQEIDVSPLAMRDISGTYESEQWGADRRSRIVIRSDGTFEMLDWVGADTATFTGRWRSMDGWFNMALEPGTVIGLDFDALEPDELRVCGEGFGHFLTDADLAIALCENPREAGLREGVYSSEPSTATLLPPTQAGQIAFVRDGRIQRSNTDGSGVVQISEGPDDAAPAWSPDGSRIAFSRSGGTAPGVYVMNADGSNAFRLTSYGGEADWSPDGGSIVFLCGQELCKVGSVGDRTDWMVATLTPWLYGQTSAPAWSPDGTRIAFISDWRFFDFVFEVWTIAPDGSGFTLLLGHSHGAPNPFAFHQPAWSPDGRRIAYGICPWASENCSSSGLGVANSDGSGMTLLLTSRGTTSPTWSPDGQLIAYSSGSNIDWVSADGSARGRIVENGHSPSWRP